ncbi:MAG: glutathione S-transferase [Myxococcota bacterium]
MVTVHHLNNSRSQRILWLLEELGVEYDITFYERNPKTKLAPKALREVHPLGKSPVLTDGGVTVAESGAIIEYVLDTYDSEGAFRPERGTSEWREYTYWLHYVEGSAMLYFVLKVIFAELVRQSPLVAKPVTKPIAALFEKSFLGPELKKHTQFWEQSLQGKAFVVGDAFSGADIQMSFALEGAEAAGLMVDLPLSAALLERYRARDAYQRALERGGPYALF